MAVLSVITYHAFPQALPGGFVGVDIFFVISGYLITGIVYDEAELSKFSFLKFYSRRIKRIFPPLALLLVSVYAIGFSVLLPEELISLGKHVIGGATFSSNFLLFLESGYFDAAAGTKPLLHLWSLAIEEQFYLVWPILTIWMLRKSGRTLPVVFGLALLSFAACVAATYMDRNAAFYLPVTRAWELLAGALIAIAQRRIRVFPVPSWFAYAGLVTIGFSVMNFSPATAFPGWRAAIPVTGAALVIMSGIGNRQSWLLGSAPLRGIGLISYSLYLWHWPLLVFARLVAPDDLGAIWQALMLAFVASVLSYFVFEQPSRRSTSRWVPIGLTLAVAACGIGGTWAAQFQGFPDRFPQQIRALLKYKFDYSAAYRSHTCFLYPDQGPDDFQSCGLELLGQRKESMVLWGDSHAAHLYPGLQAVHGAEIAIIERATSACPPLVDVDVSGVANCKDVNEDTLRLIKKIHPDAVLLSAAWESSGLATVEQTISTLKSIGIKKIYLAGPVPYWNLGLPREIYEYYARHRSLPERIKLNDEHAHFQFDKDMESLAQRSGIHYLSLMSALCTVEGCLALAGEGGQTPVAWDVGHLTDVGSLRLFQLLPFDEP